MFKIFPAELGKWNWFVQCDNLELSKMIEIDSWLKHTLRIAPDSWNPSVGGWCFSSYDDAFHLVLVWS
jgi:hypothetical protein